MMIARQTGKFSSLSSEAEFEDGRPGEEGKTLRAGDTASLRAGKGEGGERDEDEDEDNRKQKEGKNWGGGEGTRGSEL